ncbi:hypothetical protein M3Y99_00745400 [Aphelenchoides fujianensis]|nr:hypothetical protein M3Y99_00745400 [Aphelenchoides fujianensis]
MVVVRWLFAFILLKLGHRISSDEAKILAIPAMDSGSHLISFMRLIGGLASRGHQIHVMDFAKASKGTQLPPNTTVIDVHLPFAQFDESDIELGPRKRWHRYYTSARLFWDYEQDDLTFGRLIRDHPHVVDEIMGTQWDLVISDDIFSPHGYSIGMRLKKERNVPYLLYSTSGQITTGTAEQKSLGKRRLVK